MSNTLVKIILSTIVILGSGLTSVGTAGLSAVAGVAILLAIWLPDALDNAEDVV